MGTYGFGWVLWGVGTRGDTKTRQAETKTVGQDMFLTLDDDMTGKFPEHHVF